MVTRHPRSLSPFSSAATHSWQTICLLMLALLVTMVAPGFPTAMAQINQGRIAFVSDRTGQDEIYVMNADGSGVTQLTSMRSDHPAWSPDGTKIAFAAYVGEDRRWEIYVMSADGSGQTNLTNSDTIDTYPTWSPDGTRIAFASRRRNETDFNIKIMNADGSGQTVLSHDMPTGSMPAWSPDGARIAMISTEPQVGMGMNIFLVNVDGSGTQKLTVSRILTQQPAWSSDGSLLAFTEGGLDYSNIHTVNSDGSNPRALTDGGINYNPTWSPDNSRIAFDSHASGQYDIFVVNADGTNLVNLSNHVANDENPDWSPAPTSVPDPAPEQPTGNERCFEETGLCIDGRIREYWEENGGLTVFGLPIAPQQATTIEGKSVQAQWFERNRLELHPENAAPYDVLLGRLGADRLAQLGYDWQAVPQETAQDGCRFFAETGRNVCGDILAAWQASGLELDGRRGYTENENLALFGLPLTGLITETQADDSQLQVQYFERARFELHPENAPPYNVQLGLLGSEVRQ